jgi:hypothetical protein
MCGFPPFGFLADAGYGQSVRRPSKATMAQVMGTADELHVVQVSEETL